VTTETNNDSIFIYIIYKGQQALFFATLLNHHQAVVDSALNLIPFPS
jgi:hypothetical protein